MKDKTGGGAFPQYGGSGMTLRDYFAAKAMQSLAGTHHSPGAAPSIAKWAYRIADEMIKARGNV